MNSKLEDNLAILKSVLWAFPKWQYQRKDINNWFQLIPGHGRGPCAAHVIGYYFTMKKRGFTPDDLNMVIMLIPTTGGGYEQHAALCVRLEEGDYLLDNRLTAPVKWTTDLGPKMRYLRWLWMFPIEDGNGWLISNNKKKGNHMALTKRNKKAPAQLLKFRGTLSV